MPPPSRLTETAFAHALPYWWVGEGVLVLTDGTLVRGFRLTGVSVLTLPDAERNLLVSFCRSFLNALPVGYQLQVLRHSRPVQSAFWEQYAGLGHTPEPVLREQRAQSAHFLRGLGLRSFDTYLFLSKPQAFGRLGGYHASLGAKLFDKLTGRRHPDTITREVHSAAVEDLHNRARSLVRALEPARVQLEPLGDQELASLAFGFLNPGRSRLATPPLTEALPPRTLPPEQRHLYRALSLREQLVHTPLTWNIDTLFLDDPICPHRVMGLKAMPPWTEAGHILQANRLTFEHWLSVGIGVPDSEARYENIDRRRKRARAHAAGYVRDVKADEQAEELEAAMKSMVSRDQRVFELSLHVLFGADTLTELDRRTDQAVEVFAKDMRTPLTTEQMAQLEAYLGMLPGNAHRAPHRQTVLTDNAADFLPIYTAHTGDRRPLFLATTRSGEPFAIDVADPAAQAWNWNIFGQTGGGKTFFVLSLATSSMLGIGSPLIVIDVGGKEKGSYYRLVQLLGGDFVSVSLDGSLAINPFFTRADLYTDDEGRPSRVADPAKLLFLAGLAKLLVTDPGALPPGIVASAILEQCILRAYERLGDSRPPIFSDLADELERYTGEDAESTATARHLAKNLRAQLSTARARVINQQSRVNIRSRFVVFDLKGIEDLGEFATIMLLVISSYVWAMINRPRSGNAWLAWVVYDEVWKLMRDPTAARLISELYRTARKLKAGVMAITQELADFLAVPEASAILANATNTALLKHAKGHEQVAELLSLNPRELELFRSLSPKKGHYSEVFLKQGSTTTVIRCTPSPWDYWVNTTDGVDRDLEQEVLRRFGGNRLAALRHLAEKYPNGAPRGQDNIQAA
jgi:type IV secretory pathway VirB4 component